jgi:hypothetical protein
METDAAVKKRTFSLRRLQNSSGSHSSRRSGDDQPTKNKNRTLSFATDMKQVQSEVVDEAVARGYSSVL